MIMSYAPNWSIIYDHDNYNHKTFIVQATDRSKFCHLDYFLKAQTIFGWKKVAKNAATFWATFPKAKCLHFQLNKQFKSMVCCRFFKGLKVFWKSVFDFQIELRGRYFGNFWLGNCLGYFFQYLGDFHPIFWSPCLLTTIFCHISGLKKAISISIKAMSSYLCLILTF